MCDVAIGQGVTVDRSHMGRGGGGDIRWWSVPLSFHFEGCHPLPILYFFNIVQKGAGRGGKTLADF